MKSDKENYLKNDTEYVDGEHVKQSLGLDRHKTDLDQTKTDKLRPVNFDKEDLAFLQKCEKHAKPDSPRRSSIDASISKVNEVNMIENQSVKLNEGHVSQKPKRRSTISEDFPYTLDNSRPIADHEKNLITDSYRRSILFGEKRQKDGDEKKPTLVKKQTLKPINVRSPTIEFSHDGYDDEIRMIQGGFRKRSNTADSMDLDTSINKLRSRRQSAENMSVIRLPSIKPLNKYSPRTRKKKTLSTSSSLEMSDEDCGETKSGLTICASKSVDSIKGILRKTSPNPVANASVFIHTEPEPQPHMGNVRRSSFDISSLIKDENPQFENLQRKTRSPSVSFLPIIPQSPTLVHRENVSVEREQEHELKHSQNDTTKESGDLNSVSSECSPRLSRRSSLTTSALKLKVDTHHGAAKLRYIARLAHEMEKEETARLPPEERPIPVEKKQEEIHDKAFLELRNCRYLRMTDRQESSDNDCNNESISLSL